MSRRKVKSETTKANPVGRPSEFTQEVADKICQELATGKSLRTVCAGEEMPSLQTIFNWFGKHPQFVEQYARAKQESSDAMAEEILDIADDGTNDWMKVKMGSKNVDIPNKEVLQRSKLRVETRQWLMSKMKPKKYGDKVDVTSDGKAITGNTIVLKDFNEKK